MLVLPISLLVFTSGVLHFVVLKERFRAGLFLGLSYLMLGALEIIWSIYFAYSPSPFLANLARIPIGILLLVFIAMQLIPKNVLDTHAEHLSLKVVCRKGLELIAFVLLCL